MKIRERDAVPGAGVQGAKYTQEGGGVGAAALVVDLLLVLYETNRCR